MKTTIGSKRVMARIYICMVLIFISVGSLGHTAFAEEKQAGQNSFDTTEALIDLLRQKGVISDEEANGFMERHKQKVSSTGQVITITPDGDQEENLRKVSKGVTEKLTKDLNNLKESYEFRSGDLIKRSILLEREVQRLEEMLTEDYKPQLQKSSWAQRVRFGGDIRLRHESVLFDDDNATDIEDPNSPNTTINTTNDEHRQRMRLRVGMKAKIVDNTDKNTGKVEAGIRVATGSVSNPVSTNHTLGHSSNDKSDIVLDRAYLKWSWRPEAEVWGNKIPELSLTGGIMKNPWKSTSLVWDSDLAFEGVVLNFKTDTNQMNSMSAFTTLGYFPLEESSWTESDKFMLGAQIGFKHRPTYGWEYQIAAAYYDYSNVEGQPISSVTLTTDETRELERMMPKYMQKGNSTFSMSTGDGDSYNHYGLLSDFKLVNVTGKVTNTLWFPIQAVLYWDWVKNLGYDTQEMSDKSGASVSYFESVSGDTGYQAGIKVGFPKPRERWDWNVFVEYRYLESDAVIDAFTDSDFHLGGTNAKGFMLGAELGLYNNVWLSIRWMSANEIEDMQITNTQSDDLSVDTIQVNLNAEF